MKSISRTLVFLFLSTIASAQKPPDLPIGFGTDGPAGSSTSMLLTMPDVHAELRVTDEQMSKLVVALRKHSHERRLLLNNLLEGKVFESPVSDQDIRQILAIHSRDFEQVLASGLLTSAQSKRLRELSFQLKGIASVYDPAIEKALSITKEQAAQLAHNRRRISPHSGVRTVRDADEVLISILTTAQLSRLRGMQGAPFRFDALRHFVERSRDRPQVVVAESQLNKFVRKSKSKRHAEFQ